MEQIRIINVETVKKVFQEFAAENKEEMLKLKQIKVYLDDEIERAEAVLIANHDKYCKTYSNYVLHYQRNITNPQVYEKLKYQIYLMKYNRCLNFVENELNIQTEEIKGFELLIKANEERLGIKCLLSNNSKEEIKNCLKDEYLQFSKDLASKIQSYYDVTAQLDTYKL